MARTKSKIFEAIDPAGHEATSEWVIEKLRGMIHRRELRAGDRLPPERDLAKLFGVSRPTLRAGIRSLAAVGVLQSRQGAGTFVVQADESPALDSNPLRLMAALHGLTPAEMFDARRKTVRNATDLKESAAMHREIYRAIRNRDRDKARDAMHHHLLLAQRAQESEVATDGPDMWSGNATKPEVDVGSSLEVN